MTAVCFYGFRALFWGFRSVLYSLVIPSVVLAVRRFRGTGVNWGLSKFCRRGCVSLWGEGAGCS